MKKKVKIVYNDLYVQKTHTDVVSLEKDDLGIMANITPDCLREYIKGHVGKLSPYGETFEQCLAIGDSLTVAMGLKTELAFLRLKKYGDTADMQSPMTEDESNALASFDNRHSVTFCLPRHRGYFYISICDIANILNKLGREYTIRL